MMRPRLTRSVLLLSCVATALIAGCSETPVAPRIARPMTGTYDFTTVLDTFEYGIPAGGPSCPNGAGYCASIHADSSGRLAGTFQVGDSVGTFYIYDGDVYVDVAGAITGVFQGQTINDAYPTGFVDGPVTMSDDRNTVSISLDRPDGDVVDLYGTMAGDSIVGRVRWGQDTYRGPAAYWYTGTFVAHRRP
jgi:hypothetical protein